VKLRNFMRAFSGGELSPRMAAHVESPQVQTGCVKLRNMICEPTGPVFNRPGFRFVKEVADSTKATRIIAFKFSADEQLGIELSEGRFRFFQSGAYVTASPPAYLNIQLVSSLNNATDEITTSTAHGYTTGDIVLLDHTLGGQLPENLFLFVQYYVIATGSTTLKLATTLGNALAGTALAFGGPGPVLGSGTMLIIRRYARGDIVSLGGLSYYATADDPAQISPITLAAAVGTHSASTDLVTSTSHQLRHGTPIQFQLSGGTLPPEIVVGRTYYPIPISTNTFAVASTAACITKYFANADVDTGADTIQLPPNHGFTVNALVQFGVVSGGTIPSGLSTTAPFFVKSVVGQLITVSSTVGGTTTDITAAGTGGFTITCFPTVLNLSANSTGSPTWQRVQPWYQMPADGTFEIPNNYAAADLFDINYFQSNDVITLLHKSYPPSELRRFGATRWTLDPIRFASVAGKPSGLSVAADRGKGTEIRTVSAVTPAVLRCGSGGTDANHEFALGDSVYLANGQIGSITIPGFYIVNTVSPTAEFTLRAVGSAAPVGSANTTIAGNPKVYAAPRNVDESQTYVVAAIGPDGGESAASDPVTVSNILETFGARNTLTWSAVPDVLGYRVYRKLAGQFGLIGRIDPVAYTAAQAALGVAPPTVTFTDFNDQPPDLGESPPIFDTEIGAAGGYPAAGCYFETRRFFAGTDNHRQRSYGTVSDTESQISYHIPVKETDRLQFDIAAREQNEIRHLVPMAQLLALTNGAEFRISPINSDALAPGSVAARAQTYIGASFVRPQVVNNSLLFVAARGGHVFEFGFSNEAGSFRSGDVSLRASHLFDRFDIVDSAFGRAPFPIAWYVSTSGQILGITYVPEEGIGGWHVHETDGVFESVCVVSEGLEDILYAVVRRVINGQTKRFVERMDPMTRGVTMAEQFFVDCGVKTSTPGATIALPHLEGKTVVALVDGKVQSSKVVTGGVIPASPAVVGSASAGLPYTATLRPMPAAYNIDDFGRSRNKNPAYAYVEVVESCAFTVGNGNPDQAPLPTVDLTKSDMQTKRIRTPIPEGATDDGTVEIIQSDPLPITIVGLGIDTALGG